MPFTDEVTGLEVITLAECIRLLEAHHVARVAFVSEGTVNLYPLNYSWDGEALVFRCEATSKMVQAAGGEFVAEIDGVDAREHTGWSVIARGRAQLVDPTERPEMVDRLKRLSLEPWAGGDKDVWIRIIPAPLTGRRSRPSRD